MPKTRLGISVGLLGAAAYFAALFGGFLVTLVLVGYVLMFEENEWLRRSVVKAFALLIVFSICTTIVNLIPNGINFINNLFAAFGGRFSVAFLSYIAAAIVNVLNMIENVVFIVLGLKALNQSTIVIPIVDQLLNKHRG